MVYRLKPCVVNTKIKLQLLRFLVKIKWPPEQGGQLRGVGVTNLG